MSPGAIAVVTASAACLVACGADDTAGRVTEPPTAVALLAGTPSPFGRDDDVWEVWTCAVPADTRSPLFSSDTWRLDDPADAIADDLDRRVGAWSTALSHGAYRARFVPGGEVTVDRDGDDSDCVESALAASPSERRESVDGVLVVATAAHAADQPGGWGRPGECDEPCTRAPASTTGRAIYVGASDFDPSWGDPALDLIEHELGHALDLPHSGDAAARTVTATAAEGPHDVYSSALDVMSDPTARRTADPRARDAQGTIAANRLALGWIPLTDVTVVDATAGRGGRRVVDLAPSNAADGNRAVVVALDDRHLLTIEFLAPIGLDDHLPRAGVAVHLVELPDCSAGPCTGSYRIQTPLTGDAPHIDLLTAGESFETHGWRITPTEDTGFECTVALEPI